MLFENHSSWYWPDNENTIDAVCYTNFHTSQKWYRHFWPCRALLWVCCTWPCPLRLLDCHWNNYMIDPKSMKQPWRIWVNGSHESTALEWLHNGHNDVSNHQRHDCLLNSLFGRRSKKTSKFHVTGLFAVNSPGTSEFPTQMANNTENVSIWWLHHGEL